MDSLVHWLQHETAGLLTLCAAGIAVLLLMIIRFRIEPFIALTIAGLLVAVAAGLPPEQIVGSAQSSGDSLLESGFGSILGHIAAIVGLGTILGSLLEASGGAQLLTRSFLRVFGDRQAPLAMCLSGFLFGIPVFFDIGVFVLAPLVYVAARQSGRSLLLYCLPLAAGLSMTHAFLPPHPGPVVAAGLLGVDLGWLIIMGLACGIPALVVSGILFPAWIGKRIHVPVPEDMLPSDAAEESERSSPGLGTVGSIIGLPMVLILTGTVGSVALTGGTTPYSLATFFGNPVVALLISVLLAFWLLGTRRGMSGADLSALTGKALRPLGMILLVVGAGGFFGTVLDETGVGDALAGSLQSAGLPLLVSAYVISAGLRIAQGSATVCIVTTGGIIAPLVADQAYSQPQLALIAVAIAAGSVIASHVNDGGFWIISRYFGISVKDTLRTWTVLETILSLVAFGVAAALSAVLA